MKKLKFLSTAVFLLLTLGISAQHPNMGSMNQQGSNTMMQGNMMGMMRGMMCPLCGNMIDHRMPMQKYMMTVNMLPALSGALSLTQAQFVRLIDLQAGFKKQQIDYSAKLKKNRMELQSLLDEKASSDKIREQMQACSVIETDMKLAVYEAAKNMKNELTEEQQSEFMDMMNNQTGMMRGPGMMQNMMNR